MRPVKPTPVDVDWDQFDPDAYIGHNYEKAVLPEDQEVIRQIITRIDALGIQPRSMQRVLNVGHGAVFTVDSIAQHLLSEAGTYDLVECGKQNLVRIQETIANGLAGSKGIWEKFEQFAAAQSPALTDGLLRVWRLSRVVPGSIYALSHEMYDAGFALYCPESITDDIAEFEEAVHAFVGSIKKDGLAVLAFVRGSEGYATAGRPFPAVSVECNDVCRLLSPHIKQLEVAPIEAPGIRPASGPQAAGIGLATGIRA